ncbi:MAG: helix-turn-helix transcriptional regulator [Acidithiobacillus ferrooxidans]|uniref:AlpA family phage regulatory protein n=1 Tax=mine drainage metagenome TaxID=410659 RepID=E6QC39_9ZZZZ
MEDRFLRIGEAARVLGIHPKSLWRWVRQGVVPPPLALSPHVKGWWLSEVREWGARG